MDIWVDKDSGTYGMDEGLLYINLSSDEAEIFSELSDSQRIVVAKAMCYDFQTWESALSRVQ